MAAKLVALNIMIPRDLKRAITEMARVRGESVSLYVRKMLPPVEVIQSRLKEGKHNGN